jgi:hypothetical protein
MEVHAHTHSARKKWTHYLWEFLMLFLAVFCGFLAENIRERMIKHEKEIHYIKSMIQDIKKDTADLKIVLKNQYYLLSKMDSALSIPVSRLRDIQSQDTFFHHFFYYYSWTSSFTQNDNVYVQLRNAGGFSVIHKQEVIDSINYLYSYYERQVKNNGKYYLDYYDKMVQLATQVIDLPVIPSTQDDKLFREIPQQNELFTRYDMPLLKQLYSIIRYDKGCLVFYMTQEQGYMALAKQMLNYLTQKYRLKNE